MREKEQQRKAELMAQRMAEHQEKERQRRESLKRQESLLKQEHLKAEQEAQRKKEEAGRYIYLPILSWIIYLTIDIRDSTE